ncbi:5p-3p exoribonuclease 1-like isoform X2 [Biomphalaria glabrata]|uniref:5'-3' exoribonuclease 1 n=1 Tax=Biomphalaria glabrata TaxID=6526 RepID=A0A9W2YLD9_BIOGL|nr:5'-3' exoribonuclease 1-like isoform X3 [Biomphalaria glabrata]
MGVPKFYRWISERYPCLSEVVKEFQLPDFDNLYLDMNGIIHVCSHPEDDNPHFRITEEKIFKDVCHYIDFLFRMIKPRKVFYMAVDGVAPRAKMNQQRGRRFRSAREAENLILKAQEKGEVLPTEKRFDSNCITPGTPFMVRLQEHLKYFVVEKITVDPLWQGPKVYLSGHETPGEGEHKIMDFIRYSKSQPDHDPETRHCLYGLDADLIMLGLTSHEPHFSLLREEVRFGGRRDKNKRPTTPEETTFHLLHLSLMRDYLAYEFSGLQNKISFPWNLESIIDDWILMGFLVGNDFIPHLPHLHIHADALPLLWKTYMNVLPQLDGYLNEGGHLNLPRFEKYMTELAKYDMETFESAFSDLRYLESKLGGKSINESADVTTHKRKLKPLKPFKVKKDGNPFVALEDESDKNVLLDDLPWDDEEDDESDDDDEEEEDAYDDDEDDFNTVGDEFKLHKRDYYMNKMSYQEVTPDILQDQARGYVIALQWILLYYFEGCPSWSWYYPHHYAPYISDVKGFSDMKITLELSKPFLPFQQLMAVLPAASKELLPPAYQFLMTDEGSPIIDFYPVNFETDLNGKQQDWEAVVLIPFIDEKRLLDAMASREQLLTKEENDRNIHGPHFLYYYTPENQGFYPSSLPGVFPDLHASRAKVEELDKDLFRISAAVLRKSLLDNVKADTYFPGFPRLKFLPHTHELAKCNCKVFQHNSRGENMLLRIQHKEGVALEDIADELLGNVTYVGWPHLHEAKVVAVANESYQIELVEELNNKGKKNLVSFKRKALTTSESTVVAREALAIKERHYDRFAIDVGNTEIIIYACPMTGKMYTFGSKGTVTLEKQFSTSRAPYLHQMTIKDLDVDDNQENMMTNLEEIFPAGCDIFMLGNPHYGAQGKVREILVNDCRLRIALEVKQEPDFRNLGLSGNSEVYFSNNKAGQQIGVDGHTMSRITGSVFIERSGGGSKANIGLNLKFTKRCEEVPGYTRRLEDGWGYSYKCVKIVEDYINSFPDVWIKVQQQKANTDVYTEDSLFPQGSKSKLADVLKYLEELPCSKAPHVKFGSQVLSEDSIKEIEEMTAALNPVPDIVKMKVKPRCVFRPLVNQGTLVPDPAADFQLYDRIVVVKIGYSVPFGKRGTITGIPNEEEGGLTPNSLYDVVFDEPFSGGITLRCSSNKGYRVPGSAMLNLTYGEFRKNVSIDQRIAAAQAGARKQTFNATSSSGKVQTSFNNNGAFGSHHSDRTALWKQQQQPASSYQRNQSMGQTVQWANGQPLFGQVFAMQNQPGLKVEPKFVTPKVQSPKQPTRLIQTKQQDNSGVEVENMEFDSLWKNLQSHKQSTQGRKSTELLPKLPPSLAQYPKQQSVASSSTSTYYSSAQKQQQISPSVSQASSHNNFTQSQRQASPSVTSLNNQQQTVSTSVCMTQSMTHPTSSTSVSLQSLFQNTSTSNSARDQQQVAENSEFLAMFNSLKVQAASVKAPTPTQVVEGENKSLADAALKQLLKIGVDTPIVSSTPPETPQTLSVSTSGVSSSQASLSSPGGNTYMRQVSLQELFEEANKHKQQSVIQSSQPPPTSVKENKDPIADLEAFCKTNLNQGTPQYDYKIQIKQNAYIANVILPNGQRYEGSLCKTKEEAAKSAASMALLCLNSKPNHPMLPGFLPGAQRPGMNAFFSNNSAFSPISLPGSGPGLLLRPQQMTGQMLLTPQHFINQPPPNLSLHHLFQQSQQMSFQNPGHMAQTLPPRHPQPIGLNPCSLPGQANQAYSAAIVSQSTTGNSATVQAGSSMTSSTSSSQQFIPLQVSRNQKHPNKRKESESESESKKDNAPKDNAPNSTISEPYREKNSETVVAKTETVKSTEVSGPISASTALNKANGAVKEPAQASAMPVICPTPSAKTTDKKRKSRLAAKFNKKINES